jgi:hypothetical protein
LIELLHTVLVISFVSVTGLLFAVTLVHRLRVRHVIMTWRASRPGAMPAWPIMFIGVVGLLYLYAINTGSGVPDLIFAAYLLGGVFWFAASLIAGTVIVTRHGVVHGIGRPGSALPWVQISDWFEVPTGRRTHFVFLFNAAGGGRQRIELPVPVPQVERFRFLVRDHLDDRIAAPIHHPAGRTEQHG